MLPNPGEPYPGEPYAGEQNPGEQSGAQPYPGQQYPGQQYPGQQYPGAQYPGQQYSTQQYGAPQFQAPQMSPQQTPGQQYPGQYDGSFGGEQQYPVPEYRETQHQHSDAHDASPAASQGNPHGEPRPAPTRTRRPRVDAHGIPYGVGRFSVREVVLLILAALVVVSSFLPFIGGVYANLFGYTSLWAPAPWLAIPGALLLGAAAVLLVLRRLKPELNLRVGSLSVDQFASVAAVSTAGFFVGALLLLLGVSAWFRSGFLGASAFGDNFDVFTPGAGLILGLIFSLAALVPTVGWRFIPIFAADFRARTDGQAHPAARKPIAVPVRPRPVKTPRPQAVPQPEVHQYGDEHAGSIQLTPADTRPEDVGAYRRRGWSPDASDAPVEAEQFADAGVQTVPETTSTIESAGDRGSSQPDADDEIDELHTGEEPAPVSAIRHVAEQESLADEPEGAVLGSVDSTTVGDRHDDSAPIDADQPDAGPSATGTSAATEGPRGTPAVISTQPFWVYSRVPLPVVDEQTGDTVFEIGPGAWALAIVDRGSELVIRHDDGRVGVLRSLSGVMRG